MVVKITSDSPADAPNTRQDEPSAPSIAPLQPQSSGHSDMAHRISEAIQSRNSPREDDDYTVISMPSEDLRHEDSDSDWDASDREDEGPARNALQPPLHPQVTGKPVAPVPAQQALPEALRIGRTGESTSPASNNVDALAASTQKLQVGTPAASVHGTTPPKDRAQTNPFLRQMSFGADAPEVVKAPESAAVSSYWQSQTFDDSGPSNHSHAGREPSATSAFSASMPESDQASVQIATAPSLPSALPPARDLKAPAVSTPAVSVATTPPSKPSQAPPLPVPLHQAPIPSVPAPSAPAQPTPIDAGAAGSSSLTQSSESPQELLEKQKNAFYSIKKIRWRKSQVAPDVLELPVLTQNANGPCPLLALVNALVLSSRPSQESGLINMLKTREQISLGLLVDAVFEELISAERPAGTPELPDLGALYRFLINLHTGMNVNPRFVPKNAPLLGGTVPGTFEETVEMRLYSTFGLPLVHGWVPDAEEPAYAAFERSAPSYEDTQNLLFCEDDLERKLSTGQLSAKEQNQFMDLATIKEFMATWPTQLSSKGLEIMREHLRPGRVGILFRNDHFSTIYKEPITGGLYALVTDAGFAPHEEIVFESLTDVRGSQTGFYSGNYDVVSEVDGQQHHAVGRDAGEQAQSRENGPSSARPAHDAPAHSHGSEGNRTEQEDADLALAMQLQEEEEERQRNEQAQRRREEELSRQFLSQDSHLQAPPAVPPRQASRVQRASPADHAPTTGAAAGGGGSTGETQLPSYEQAAAARPFHPPAGHPSSASAPRLNATEQAQQSSGRRPAGGYQPEVGSGRAWSSNSRHPTAHEASRERHEGCAVM